LGGREREIYDSAGFGEILISETFSGSPTLVKSLVYL